MYPQPMVITIFSVGFKPVPWYVQVSFPCGLVGNSIDAYIWL
jgi:hypothetical protein